MNRFPLVVGCKKGGSAWSNCCDIFATIHGHTDDMYEKHTGSYEEIKETQSGGNITVYDHPVKLNWSDGGRSFGDFYDAAPNISAHHSKIGMPTKHTS